MSNTKDYCWREFTRKLPLDAYRGGTDSKGNPIYIGQTFFDDHTIVGKIYPGDKNVIFGWINRRASTTNNKILCIPYPEKFKWVKATCADISKLAGRHLVVGGTQHWKTVYVGRGYVNGETVVGKILSTESFSVESNGQEYFLTQFEILTYEH